jgi:uncharacterized protein DUF3352
MSEPRTPGDDATPPIPEPAEPPAEPTPESELPVSESAANPTSAGEAPTEAWPSLTPSSGSAPSATSWGSPSQLSSTPSPSATGSPASPFEPAEPLPDARLGTVGDASAGDGSAAASPAVSRRSPVGLRWGLALAGIVIVLAASALIVSLASGRPSQSIALGYMPANISQYSEVRMDLPGDQRQKLAGFLANFPGFKDQAQVEPKVNEALDKLVRAVSSDKQTYTTDILPWFAGQLAVGSGLPGGSSVAAANPLSPGLEGVSSTLIVVSIKDQAKAEAWLTSVGGSGLVKASYNGADVWTTSNAGPLAIATAVTDKVLIVGSVTDVHAAIDTKGQGTLANDPDFKAALGQVDRDYAVLSVIRMRPIIDNLVKTLSTLRPGLLSGTQIDETLIAMIPAWQMSLGRFENDAFVTTGAYPSYAIGYDTPNRRSSLLDHVPPKTIAWVEYHDVGPALKAFLDKFRALPETKGPFAQFDQAMSILGGFDGVLGWWGDTAFVVTPGADGTIGGGLLIQPRDQAAATQLFATLRTYLTLAASSAGVTVRDEDHNGTKITILDYSAAPGMSSSSLPPGYKAEFAYAVADGVVAFGYGRDWVGSVLDTKPGSSLADDDRFKSGLARVGAENIGSTYIDFNAIRALVEPLAQKMAPSDVWSTYQTEVRPYLAPIDTVIQALRRDGALDRGSGAITVHEPPSPAP